MNVALSYSLATHIRVTQVSADGCVLLDTRKGSLWTLDGLAAAIIALLDSRRTIDDIVDALADEYDAPRTQIDRDVPEVDGQVVNDSPGVRTAYPELDRL